MEQKGLVAACNATEGAHPIVGVNGDNKWRRCVRGVSFYLVPFIFVSWQRNWLHRFRLVVSKVIILLHSVLRLLTPKRRLLNRKAAYRKINIVDIFRKWKNHLREVLLRYQISSASFRRSLPYFHINKSKRKMKHDTQTGCKATYPRINIKYALNIHTHRYKN